MKKYLLTLKDHFIKKKSFSDTSTVTYFICENLHNKIQILYCVVCLGYIQPGVQTTNWTLGVLGPYAGM